MSEPNYLSTPDSHLLSVVAAAYDTSHASQFAPAAIDAAVSMLAELASDGPAVEFAVGTGRLALPLAKKVSPVYGIDFSEPMIAELTKKDIDGTVAVTAGDMTSTQVCSDASLVFLVYNTIQNLRTQDLQLECFYNAGRHLAQGGRFVVETMTPRLRDLPPGERIVPFDVSPTHLGFEEYVDLVNQISISHHYNIDGERVRVSSPSFRYVWHTELDLMARLAGMTLENRWADWSKNEFTGDSFGHVSVWRKL